MHPSRDLVSTTSRRPICHLSPSFLKLLTWWFGHSEHKDCCGLIWFKRSSQKRHSIGSLNWVHSNYLGRNDVKFSHKVTQIPRLWGLYSCLYVVPVVLWKEQYSHQLQKQLPAWRGSVGASNKKRNRFHMLEEPHVTQATSNLLPQDSHFHLSVLRMSHVPSHHSMYLQKRWLIISRLNRMKKWECTV